MKASTRSALEASMVLAVGMGLGRFAFTAVFPHMIEDGLLDLDGASIAASTNYAGYLLGAILAMWIRPHNAHRLCLWASVGTAVCLALLAGIHGTQPVAWIRAFAGCFSAISMVAATLWLLEHRGHPLGAPLLFSGVGLGIAASSELLVVISRLGGHSGAMWLILAAVALLVGIAVAPGLHLRGTVQDAPRNSNRSEEGVLPHLPLVALYGLAGFGYIVTATYLPVLVKLALPDLDPAHVWAVFGLGAAPSCFMWHVILERIGTRKALFANLLLQAVGVLLPVVAPSSFGYLTSALLVGATFMGTVTITMPAARRMASQGKPRFLAVMTVAYGAGQIVGPMLAQRLYASSHGLNSSLLAATSALLVAALLSLLLKAHVTATGAALENR